MKNELLRIGPFTLYGYGMMIAAGVLAAYLSAQYRARKRKIREEHVFWLVVWCTVGGLLGSKLLFWLTELDEILRDPGFFLETLMDGFVVYGGILGGILAGFFYCRSRKLHFLEYFDLMIPSVALAQGFGRVGCFLAGCCYGKQTDSPLSVIFHDSDFAPNGVPLIPVQIYSSLLNFLHFGVLLVIARHKKKDGQVAACYMIFYGIGRFLVEFLRGDAERGNVGVFSTSQFISIFMGMGGVLLLAAVTRKDLKKRGRKKDVG